MNDRIWRISCVSGVLFIQAFLKFPFRIVEFCYKPVRRIWNFLKLLFKIFGKRSDKGKKHRKCYLLSWKKNKDEPRTEIDKWRRKIDREKINKMGMREKGRRKKSEKKEEKRKQEKLKNREEEEEEERRQQPRRRRGRREKEMVTEEGKQSM